MILATALAALSLTLGAPRADSLVSADSAMKALVKGGYTIMWRHGATDRSVQEPMDPFAPRFLQRNLTDKGVTDAKAVGVIFKALGIPVGDVVASPVFRTKETAEYAFGRATTDMLLRTLEASPEERWLILALPAPGTNRVLVTHHFIIERNAPGINPGDVNEGEAVVLKSDGTTLRTIAVIKMTDWTRLSEHLPASASQPVPATPPTFTHGPAASQKPAGGYPAFKAPLVIPASLKTAKTAVAADYLAAFNSGDVARMRSFFETTVVPNPARTMEQRMESYAVLSAALGTLAIESVDLSVPNQIIVNTSTSTGKTAKITIGVEEAAPYRAKAISFQYGAG